MARKRRDYKAEYARRKQLETDRAKRENRTPDLHRARGHGSSERERIERQVRGAYKRNELIDKARYDAPGWAQTVSDIAAENGWVWMDARLRRKIVANTEYLSLRAAGFSATEAANGSSGQGQYWTDFVTRNETNQRGRELYFYHGGED